MEINDRELRQTMQEFLDQDQKNRNIWNAATMSGVVILFLVSSYLMQLVFGRSWGPDLTGLINILPVIGVVVLAIVGFGYWTETKKNRESDMLKNDSDMLKNDIERSGNDNRDFQKASVDRTVHAGGSDSSEYSDKDSKNTQTTQTEDSSYTGPSSESGSGSRIDSYGLRQNKKLYKDRSDKKLCGVCGGLATYFGISSTVIRLIFVILTLIGWGSAAILYLALCIALKKEPVEVMG